MKIPNDVLEAAHEVLRLAGRATAPPVVPASGPPDTCEGWLIGFVPPHTVIETGNDDDGVKHRVVTVPRSGLEFLERDAASDAAYIAAAYNLAPLLARAVIAIEREQIDEKKP